MEYFYLYILKCNDNSYYTGHTDNIEKRFAEHNAGNYEGYTAKRLPVVLVYCATFPSRIAALEAEQKIKSWSRKKKEALIKSDWKNLSIFAKKIWE